MFFSGWSTLFRTLVIGVLAYINLIVLLRISGRRTLSKMNAFDLVVTVALGSTLATVLLSKDIAFLEGALAFCMLALLQWLVARLSVRSAWFSDLVRSRPRLLVEDGAFRPDALRDERVTVLNQTPSAFAQLQAVDDGRPLALRYVIFGGEALDLPRLQPWFARRGDTRPQLVNMYGITETTVHVTYRALTAADALAASEPISAVGLFMVK